MVRTRFPPAESPVSLGISPLHDEREAALGVTAPPSIETVRVLRLCRFHHARPDQWEPALREGLGCTCTAEMKPPVAPEIEFATDSSLEGTRFELLVPLREP
jgi:hypothetical protein